MGCLYEHLWTRDAWQLLAKVLRTIFFPLVHHLSLHLNRFRYVDGVKANEHRRHIGRLHNFDVKRNEFLCPLCETIGNTVLPLLPNFKEFTNHGSKVIDITFDDWLDGLKNTLDHSIQKELNDDKDTFIMNPFPLSSITKFMAEAVARNFNQLFSYGLNDASQQSNEPKILDDMSNIIDIFARSAFVVSLNIIFHRYSCSNRKI